MPYLPDTAVHPGASIMRALAAVGMSQKSLAERTGISEKHWSHVITGKASITVDSAVLLENVLGGSATFWANLQTNYETTLARAARLEQASKEADRIASFPYSELVKHGLVDRTHDNVQRVRNLWKYFAVNSLASVPAVEGVAFSKSIRVPVKRFHIASWLRWGEIEHQETRIPAYDSAKLKAALPDLRAGTTRSARASSREAKELLAQAGVSLVYTPHFSGVGVAAATRWIGDTPLVQISIRGGYADIFWFTLFHELGHVLHHGKKLRSVKMSHELKDIDLSVGREEEAEADAFASNQLIPPARYRVFVREGDFSRSAIMVFAKRIGIDPGIVQGRLCHDGHIAWSARRGFRRLLQFTAG